MPNADGACDLCSGGIDLRKYETHSEWKHAIHERIAKEIAKYNQVWLASYLGFESVGTVSKWKSFNHDTVPEIATIVAIANLLDVSVEYLLCITDERKPFHHDDPIDWKVIEDRSPRKQTANDAYMFFKNLGRKNYLRLHRSKAGRAIQNIKTATTAWDRIKAKTKSD